jgi:hypothetical protein
MSRKTQATDVHTTFIACERLSRHLFQDDPRPPLPAVLILSALHLHLSDAISASIYNSKGRRAPLAVVPSVCRRLRPAAPLAVVPSVCRRLRPAAPLAVVPSVCRRLRPASQGQRCHRSPVSLSVYSIKGPPSTVTGDITLKGPPLPGTSSTPRVHRYRGHHQVLSQEENRQQEEEEEQIFIAPDASSPYIISLALSLFL